VTQSAFPSHLPWSTTGVQVPAEALHRSPGRSGWAAARRLVSSGVCDCRFITAECLMPQVNCPGRNARPTDRHARDQVPPKPLGVTATRRPGGTHPTPGLPVSLPIRVVRIIGPIRNVLPQDTPEQTVSSGSRHHEDAGDPVDATHWFNRPNGEGDRHGADLQLSPWVGRAGSRRPLPRKPRLLGGRRRVSLGRSPTLSGRTLPLEPAAVGAVAILALRLGLPDGSP